MKLSIFRAGVALCSFFISLTAGFAQGTAFTYQGRLIDNGTRANGSYDLDFALYDAASGGNLIGTAITNSSVAITNGLFTTSLDFGAGVFTNGSRWLEVSERTNGSGSFTLLTPRQPMTAAPYAVAAGTLSGTLSASQLSGTIPVAQLSDAVLTNGASGVTLSGIFSGDGSGVTNVPGTTLWQVVAGTSQVAVANRAYLLTNNAASSLLLPISANVGDVVTVAGTGSNGWSASYNLSAPWTAQNSGVKNWAAIASSADGTKLVAVAVADQIYTSADSGVTWTARFGDGSQNWQSVASSADGIKLVAVVLGGNSIYTSTDSGVIWTAHASDTENWYSVASSADGTKLAAVAYGGQIYTSTDSGMTWTAQNSGSQNWRAIASSADGVKLVAATDGSSIYTSTNSGITWTAQNSGNWPWVSVASSADGVKLVAAYNVAFFNGGPIYTSTNSGVTWVAQSMGNQPWVSLASAADGIRLAGAVKGGQIYTSTNSGVTWTAQNSGNQSWTAITTSADGTKLAAGINGGPIYTYTFGYAFSGPAGTTAQFQYLGNGQWQPVMQSASQIIGTFTGNVNGTATTAINVVAGISITNAFITNSTLAGDGSGVTNVPGTMPWQVVAGTSQAAIANRAYLLTNNAASSLLLPASANVGDVVTVSGIGSNGWSASFNIPSPWTAQNTGNESWQAIASSADGTKLIAVADQIYTSTDSGVTWTARFGDGSQNWLSVASSADGTKLVAGTFLGQIYTSSDSGVTWTEQSSGDQDWNFIASSADGSQLAAVIYGGSIYTSSDSGVTWTAQNSGDQNWTSIASSADGTRLAATVYGGSIYTSSDSGVTWTAQNSGNQHWTSIASSADGIRLAATVYGGSIYTSSDSGVTWIAQNSGNQNWQGVVSSADGTELAAVAFGTPVYTSSDSGITWTAQNSGSRTWISIASSADGSKLAVAVNAGQIYTHVSAVSLFSGPAGTTTQFQYIGNGQWQSVTQSASQILGPFNGNGSGLTNLNASQISSGTILVEQLPATVVTNTETGVTLSGTFTGSLDGVASSVISGISITNAFITNSIFAGDGSGVTNVPGTMPWQVVAGTSQTAVANRAYLLTNNTASVLALPASANVGDIVTVTGTGANGWTVNAVVSTNEWTAQNVGYQVWTSVAVSADGTKLAAVAQGSPIYTSTDSGVTWTAQNSGGQNWGAIASSADGTKLVAVAYNNQIYTSTDSGTNWTAQFGDGSQFWWSVASSADGTKLVAVDQNGEIYTSTDSGTNWAAQFGDGSQTWQSVASSADGTKLVAAAFPGQIYTSTDSGVTWTAQNSGVQFWQSVASSADGVKLAAAMGNGLIYTSTDSGVTWTAQNSGSQQWQSITTSADGTKLVAVVFGGQIYISTNSGTNWTTQAGAGTQRWWSIASSADGTKLVAVINGGSSIYTYGPTSITVSLASGPAGTTAQIQYIGNGQWQPVTQSASPILGTLNGNGSGLTNVNAISVGGSQILLNPNGILLGTNINMNVHPIYLKNSGDVNHGLAWRDSVTNFNGLNAPDGPVLWGFDGGALGAMGGGAKLALVWTTTGIGIGTNTITSGHSIDTASGAYLTSAGVWTSVSDRNVKEDFTNIEPQAVLAKVAAMPITQWKYKKEANGIKHIGPVAQDFYGAFGLGDSERAIGSIDEDGVALAAIQGLNQKLEEQKAQAAQKDAAIQKLVQQNQSLADQLKELQAAVKALQTAGMNK